MIVIKILNRIQVILYEFFNNITAGVLAVIICTVTAGVVSRYVFNKPFIWTEELCTVLLIYLAFCSAPMATISKEHIVADFLLNMIPPKFQKILSVFIRLVEITFFLALTISCARFIPGRTFRSAVLGITRHAYYIPVLVGSAAMVYSLLVHMLNGVFPGYDYFSQRKEARENEVRLMEEKEQERVNADMDAFVGAAEKKQHGGQK